MKPKEIMFGVCPSCGKEIVRQVPCTIGACPCHNPPFIVDLEPRFQIRLRNVPEHLFQKIMAVAKGLKCSPSEALNRIIEQRAIYHLEWEDI